MTITKKIRNKIAFLHEKLETTSLKDNQFYIIIHPETERNIYLEGEVSKSENLEDYLGFPIILSKQVKVNEIIIGV